MMNIVVLGLSITSSWGNGHATTYRALLRQLVRQGHHVLFLERDMPWYAAQRDLPVQPAGAEPGHLPFGDVRLYDSLPELQREHQTAVRAADAVIIGSYVPEGVEVGRWVLKHAQGCVAFYDIDTPVTLAKLAAGDYEYLSPELIPRYDLYLSFTGGPLLERLEREYAAKRARALYCSVDPEAYYPKQQEQRWDLGYLGTYSEDRQAHVNALLLEPARRWPRGRFAIAGAQFPAQHGWPPNVKRFEHLAPAAHRGFYNAQRFTLNVTRAAMIATGFAPSVRLFEAAACGVPVISDRWAGLERFFIPDEEILLAETTEQALSYLRELPETERSTIGRRARRRVLEAHTATHRARELVEYLQQARPTSSMNTTTK